MFLSSEHFISYHSGGLSKVSYLVPYPWLLSILVVVFWQWTKYFLICKRRCCHVNHTKSDQTGVCSSLVVATPGFVGVDVVGG